MSHPTAPAAPHPAGRDVPDLLRLVQRYEEFAGVWEKRAKDWERFQTLTPGHVLVREIMADLRRWARDLEECEVNLETAATLTGYSTRQLRRKLAGGTLKNRGAAGAPRMRLHDLEKK